MLINENPLPFCLVTEHVEVLPSAWSLSMSKCCLVTERVEVLPSALPQRQILMPTYL
jgi:hypothetical protein